MRDHSFQIISDIFCSNPNCLDSLKKPSVATFIPRRIICKIVYYPIHFDGHPC